MGAKVQEKINEIEDGVARHVFPEGNPLREILGVDHMDFRWSRNKENNRVFECEEVVLEQTYGISDKETYCCKYMHSIFAEDESCKHADGAMRCYSDTELLNRFDSDLAKYGKNTDYIKIWRVDGGITCESFMNLVHFFYRGNTLISEYFCDTSTHFIECQNVEHKNINHSKNIGIFDDVIVSTGFMGIKKQYETNTIVSSTYICGKDKYIESSYIGLKKIFIKNNIDFAENQFKIIHFNDGVVNLPIVSHFGADSFSEAHKTLSCIKDFIQNAVGFLDLISFTISCEVDESINKSIFFSFAGSKNKVIEIIEKIKIPQSYELIRDWCIHMEEYMTKKKDFKLERDPLDFVSSDGTLKFERIFLHIQDIIFDNKNFRVKFEGKVENNFAHCFTLDEIECSKCGEDYYTCDCITNKNYKFKINVDDLLFFNTDRPLNSRLLIYDEHIYSSNE